MVEAKETDLGGSVNPGWQDLSVEQTDKSRLAARDPSTSVGMTEKTERRQIGIGEHQGRMPTQRQEQESQAGRLCNCERAFIECHSERSLRSEESQRRSGTDL